VGHLPSSRLLSTENKGYDGADGDIEMAEMGWVKIEVVESDGERKFDEGSRKMYGYGMVGKSGLEGVCCDVEVMQKVLTTMDEGLINHEMVDWTKSGATQRRLPS